MADTSSIRNRALVFAFSTCPYIATTFAGPSAAQGFYQHSTWRWAFGAFTIITPAIFLPLIVLFGMKQRQAKKEGLVQPRNSGRTWTQSLVFYYHEFDRKTLFLFSFSPKVAKHGPKNVSNAQEA